MADPKNGKGGFKEFAKHEKVVVETVPALHTHPAAPTSILGSPAPKPDVAKTNVKP